MSRAVLAPWIARAHLVLAFYVLGCLVLENDVNYATWATIPPEAFGAYHQALQSRLELLMFTPMGLQLFANLALVWLRPASLPRGWVLAALLLHLYVLVESLLVQVPLHAQLDAGSTPALLERLLTTHRTFRLPGELAAFVADVVLLVKLTPPARA